MYAFVSRGGLPRKNRFCREQAIVIEFISFTSHVGATKDAQFIEEHINLGVQK